MAYSYNNKKFKEFLEERRLSKRKVRLSLNMANDITVQRWLDGEDVYIGRLLEFCNIYDVSPLSFINSNGTSLYIETSKSYLKNDIEPVSDDITELKIQKERAIAEINLQHQKELFAVKEELHRKEMNRVREITELTIRLREEERTRLFEQHDLDLLNSKKEMDELRNKTEQLLSEKNRENAILQQKLNNLQLEYKELEVSTRFSGSIIKPTTVAEPTTAPYTRTRK